MSSNRSKWQKLLSQAKQCKKSAEQAKVNATSSKHKGRIDRYIRSLDSKIRYYQDNATSKIEPPKPAESSFVCSVPQDLYRRRSRKLLSLKENAAEDTQLKRPQDLTEAELKEAMKAREKAQASDKQAMMDQERAWFEHYYGTDPVAFDETGKMIQPKPVRQPPSQLKPVTTKDGKDLEAALSDMVEQLPSHKDEAEVVKAIQSGLNMLTNKQNQSPLPSTIKQVKLKEDGVAGPKTSFGLKKALVENGTSKVSEALALGQFKETVKKAKKDGPQNLADELGASFAPLLPKKKTPKEGFQMEGLALQDTLNDFGASLKDDGIVGPKTTDAFGQIAKKTDEDELTGRFAYNLGFYF